MSKTIKLTQRQRSEPAQRYLAFTLIPFTFTLIFSHLHFTGTLHICVMAVMPCHGLYHHRSTEGCVTSPRRHRLFWEWQTIILLSTAIWVVFLPSSLLIFSWLLTMTSLSPLMMHLIRLSDPCCQQTHEPLSRARGRVLVKRGNCYQSRSEEWRTAWSRFLMTLLKVKFTESGLLDTAKWSAIRIISIQTTTLPSLPGWAGQFWYHFGKLFTGLWHLVRGGMVDNKLNTPE